MKRILLVSTNGNSASNASSMFEKHSSIQTTKADSGAKALEIIVKETFDVAVINESLSDMSGLDLCNKMVEINPFLNCALISGLPHDEYHEASEGLGLIMQLPVLLTEEDVNKLLSHLEKIARL